MDNHPNSSSSFQVMNQFKLVQGNLNSLKRNLTAGKSVGNTKKGKGSAKEQQQIVSQPKNPDSSRITAPPAASTNIVVRPAPGNMFSLKQSGSHSQVPPQQRGPQKQQSHTSSVQRISQDRIKLVNNQVNDNMQLLSSQMRSDNHLHQLPYVPSSHIQVSQHPSKQANNINGQQSLKTTSRIKVESNDSNRQMVGQKMATQRKQHSSKLQSRKSSNTIAPGSVASDQIFNSKNQLKGHIITFDERAMPQEENDIGIVQSVVQNLQASGNQVQSLQTIQTDRDMQMGHEDSESQVYDFLPDNRSIKPKSKMNALTHDTHRDLRTYSTNARDGPGTVLIASQWNQEFQRRFTELRLELFKEIEMINIRLQNIESTVQTQRGTRHPSGFNQQNSPGQNGYGTVNMTGFADTVKVTFSNTKADVDNMTEVVQPASTTNNNTKGRPNKKGKKKKKVQQDQNNLEDNEEDSEIGDIQNFFQVPTNEHLQGNNKFIQKSNKEDKQSANLGKEEHIRRSMREIRNRRVSNKIQDTQHNSKPMTPLLQPDYIKEYDEDLLQQMNFDIKSPIQQELRLSKVASQERVATSNYMMREKGQITQSQRQQLRVQQDQQKSPSKQSSKTTINLQREQQRITAKQGHQPKASSSLSQSRKEKIIELNQKLLKSPNIVINDKTGVNILDEKKEKMTSLLTEKQQVKKTSKSKLEVNDLEYKKFLENDDKQISNPANFGTFGGKNKHNQGLQWTEGPEDQAETQEVVGKLSLIQKPNSELQTIIVNDSSKGFINSNQRISASSKKGLTDHQISQQLFIKTDSLHKNKHQKISNPRLISSSTFSNGEIDNGDDDFDEKMDQRQYQHNISQKSNWGPGGSHDVDAQRVSNLGPNMKNGQVQKYQIAENDDDDDDGGFLSDEVDERRSYTPPPRGISTMQDGKDDRLVQNNMDISSITIDNNGDNNATTIMNLSKISKINEINQPSSLKSIQKNPSTMLPSTSGPNLLSDSQMQPQSKQNQGGFMAQPMVGAHSQIYQQQNNMLLSGNNSFINKTGLNVQGGVNQQFQNMMTNKTSQNRQLQMKQPGTSLNVINKANELQNDKMSVKSGTGSNIPLTARVNSNNIANQVHNQNYEPRVKSLQRQPIVTQTEAKSGINTIYKSPVRNVGGNAPSLSKPRSAYGGDSKQTFNNNNNGNFGQVFIQNLRDLSGIRNNNEVQGHTSRVMGGDQPMLSSNEISGFNGHNQSRQNAQNQMAQNLRKTPGTSMGLMTSVKSQNGGGGSNNGGGRTQQYTANSFNHNLDNNQNSFILGMQGGNTQPQSQSFKHNLHALMAQKGSKCKCHPSDFEGQENGGEHASLNIFTRNEDEYHQKLGRNEQDYEEISMGSVGAGSDEVGDAQEHRPMKKGKRGPQKKKFCSSYCKRIGPKEQRQIILECLRIEVNEIEQGQVLLFKGQGEQEQSFVIKSSFNKLQRYIIDAKWWAKWCDYTNFDQNDILLEQLDFNQKEQNGGLMRQFSEQQLQNYLSAATNRRFESTQLYQKPPRIENECLLEQRNFEGGIGGSGIDAHFTSIRGLRENLTQHYDFEALYPSMWLHLYSWYSADTQIARYLKIDSFNQEDMLGSMGSTTLKQALAEGEFKDQNGKNKLKQMELDLYPQKLNSKAFKNQFYHFDDYHPTTKENDSVATRLLNSDTTKKNNTGQVSTDPGAKEAQSSIQNNANTSTFGFNLSGFNKMINPTTTTAQASEKDASAANKPTASPTGQSMQKKGKSFVEKRPSIQGLLGRQAIPESTVNIKQSGKQSTGTGAIGSKQPVSGGLGKSTTNGSGSGGIEFQQKRNSYSFNRKDQPRISPQNDMSNSRKQKAGGPGYGAASSTSPVAQHRGQQMHQKSIQEEASQGTSIGQRLMSYFNNK